MQPYLQLWRLLQLPLQPPAQDTGLIDMMIIESSCQTFAPLSGRDRVLLIMAKAPRPGGGKTRLAPGLSSAAVAAFYCCLLHDTLALAQSLNNAEVAIMCPGSDVNELSQLAG